MAAEVGVAMAVAGGAAAAFSSAHAGAVQVTAPNRASMTKRFFMMRSLQGFLTGFAGADADDLFKVENKDFAVADLSGAGGFFDKARCDPSGDRSP